MTFLTPRLLNSDDPVQALLSLTEEAALCAAMRALDPEDAALAIGRAPTIEEKSRLIWALDSHRRAEVMDRMHPGFIGALIQNREAENRHLLGDVSRQQFTRLLRYCSPERAYHWLILATSFDDPNANVLPLLLPLDDLATALLSEPEFEHHCQSIGGATLPDLGRHLEGAPDGGEGLVTVVWPDGSLEEFPLRGDNAHDIQRELELREEIQDATIIVTRPDGKVRELELGQGLNVEDLGLDLHDFKDIALAVVTLFGAEKLLKQYPIRDPNLRRHLQTILDHDLERYAALIHAALEIADYRRNHREELDVIGQDPILLNDLLTLEEERARVGLTTDDQRPTTTSSDQRPTPAVGMMAEIPNLPVRRSGELMRVAMQTLPAPRQAELSQELQLLFLQEAAYAGGSFLQADLEQAAGRVQFYVQMGLAGLADGDAERASRLLEEQRLRTLMESGARQVERMRQVALRLRPWQEVLEERHVRLLESLVHPDPWVEETSGRPVLRLLRKSRREATETMQLEAIPVELEAVRAWVTLVRAVGKDRVARLRPAHDPGTIRRALVVAALLYRRWDPELIEPGDVARCRETYLDPATGRFQETAYRTLAEATRALAARRRLEPRAVEDLARLLAQTMDELAAIA